MDPPEEDEEKNKPKNRRDHKLLQVQPIRRCFFTFGLPILASFLFSFVVGVAALVLGHLSAAGSASVSVPSTCKILSSSVDIRNSKVCELGLLNHKTKQLIHPSEKSTVRCRDDYYWASIFQVEYKEYFSGQIYQSIAEAPKEALPHFCRPNFNTAYRALLKFKVNETYNCRYTLGNWKPEIYSDNNNLFNCQAEKPSILQLIRRISILFIKSYFSESFVTKELLGYAFGGAVTGISCGFFASLFLTAVKRFFFSLYKKQRLRALLARLRCICMLTLYLSAIGWLTLQYTQFIGLKQLILESRLKHWVI
ncbi:hypothetical protein LUZ60_016973 [Juncus effusus]|nr:hypothetical protein LUZ60_016973 [Juncus effusus]